MKLKGTSSSSAKNGLAFIYARQECATLNSLSALIVQNFRMNFPRFQLKANRWFISESFIAAADSFHRNIERRVPHMICGIIFRYFTRIFLNVFLFNCVTTANCSSAFFLFCGAILASNKSIKWNSESSRCALLKVTRDDILLHSLRVAAHQHKDFSDAPLIDGPAFGQRK